MSITPNEFDGGQELIAGDVKSTTKPASAGTYYYCQLLGRITTTGVYALYNDGAVDGTEIARAICCNPNGLVLGSEGLVSTYITGSEVQSGALVDSSGAPLDVTDAIVEQLQDVGIIVKLTNEI